MNNSSKERYYTLDIARAIAIVLVAIGHFGMKPQPEFYGYLHDVIYTFHMPLFMFVSGFLCVITINSVSYLSFIKKKFYRLLIPYFVVSVIIITIKLISESSLSVQNPVVISDYLEMLWLPKAGSFLWFVYALWWMMVIIPFFNNQTKRKLLFLLSIGIYVISPYLPEIFCFRQTGQFMIYFAGGCVMYDMLKVLSIKKVCMASFVAFPILAYLVVSYNFTPIFLDRLISVLTAFTGIGFAITISNLIERNAGLKINKLLFSLSSASYIIYLFHTTFMGFSKAILIRIHFFIGGNLFYKYTMAEFLVPIISGIVVPWMLFYIIKRYRITRLAFGLK